MKMWNGVSDSDERNDSRSQLCEHINYDKPLEYNPNDPFEQQMQDILFGYVTVSLVFGA